MPIQKKITQHWSFPPDQRDYDTINQSNLDSSSTEYIDEDIKDIEDEIQAQIKSLNNNGKIQIIKGQNDISANTSVTNNKDELLLY